MRLGVKKTQKGYQFAFANAKELPCTLLLFKKGEDQPEFKIPMERAMGDIYVADVEHRLVGEKEEFASEFLLIFCLKHYRASRFALEECFLVGQEHIGLKASHFVAAGLCLFESACEACFYCLEVFELQFVVDNLFVTYRID